MTQEMVDLYAVRDTFATPEATRQLEPALRKLGKSVELHIYDDADHAVFNDERSEVYNAADAADA